MVQLFRNLPIPGLVPETADETEWMNLDLIREQTKELNSVITTYLYSLEDRAKVHILILMLSGSAYINLCISGN